MGLSALGGEPRAEETAHQEIVLAAGLSRAFREAQLAIARALGRHQLTGLEYQLLLSTGAAGHEGVIQGALVGEVQCSKTRVSLLVRSLAQRGLVETLRGGPDRRQARVRLTPKGEQLLVAALRAKRSAVAEVVSRLDPGDLSRMAEQALRSYVGLDVSLVVRPSSEAVRPSAQLTR